MNLSEASIDVVIEAKKDMLRYTLAMEETVNKNPTTLPYLCITEQYGLLHMAQQRLSADINRYHPNN